MSASFFEKMNKAEIERLYNDENLRRLKPDMISQMELENERIGYLPPRIGEECKQLLNITRDGKVMLTHFYYSGDFLGSDDEHREHTVEEWTVEPEIVDRIYKRTLGDFKYFYEPFMHDVGSWILRIKFNNEKCLERRCSNHTQPEGFSEYLRDILRRDDIYGCM